MSTERDRVAQALPAYTVAEELGRGAFGVVWAGEHRRVGRRVAIKQLAAPDAGVRARFLEEAKVLASLEHPHVVPLYDYVEYEDLCLLVMERLDGGTLAKRFTLARRVDVASACAVAMVTCSALHHAHRRGVMHRDVKPDNLLFSSEGVLKVTDFGIAKVAGANSHITAFGELKGTPAYMAPEQVAGHDPGPGVDVYATGLLLYELLCGKLPFSEEGLPIAVAFRRLNEEPIPLDRVAPDLPPGLSEVIMKALNRLPEDRFATAKDFGVAIGQAASRALGPGWLDNSRVELLAPGPILDSAHIAGGPVPEARRRGPTVIASPEGSEASEGSEGPEGSEGSEPPGGPDDAAAAVTASPAPPPPAAAGPGDPQRGADGSWPPPPAPPPLPWGGRPAEPPGPPPEDQPTLTDMAEPTQQFRHPPPGGPGPIPDDVAGWGSSSAPVPVPEPPRRGGSRAVLIGAAVAAVVLVAAGAAWLAVGGGGKKAATSTTVQSATSAPTTAPTSVATTTPASAEQAAATQLNGLLQQSNGARNLVVAATQQVGGCQEDPRDGIAQLQTGITEREAVIHNLGAVPLSSLTNGPPMVAALNQGLQASVEADRHYINWMDDMLSAGKCPLPSSNPAFQAAASASVRATAAKKTFVGFWNTVAAKYNLAQYSERDL